jgi:hypothetical protein
MSHDFRDSAHGLTTERHFHINRLLMDYSPNLSLRRIAENDPAFAFGASLNPPKIYGVWEDGVASSQSNWVFTLADMSIDTRVLARIMENDMKRSGVDERKAKLVALGRAEEAGRLKQQMNRMEERREEMIGLGKLAGKKSTIRHTFANGEKVIIGDRIEPVTKGRSIII